MNKSKKLKKLTSQSISERYFLAAAALCFFIFPVFLGAGIPTIITVILFIYLLPSVAALVIPLTLFIRRKRCSWLLFAAVSLCLLLSCFMIPCGQGLWPYSRQVLTNLRSFAALPFCILTVTECVGALVLRFSHKG